MAAVADTWVRVGRIGKPFGLKGEIVVHYYADAPDRFAAGARVFVLTPAGRVEATVADSRAMVGKFVARFVGRESVEAVKPWAGCHVEVPAAALPPPQEGSYYEYQLLGLRVYGADGECVGRIREVMATGGNDVFVVHGDGREFLIPVIDDAIALIDLEAGRVVLKDLEGLIAP
ncbi:MAG: 16S rRNA processing protein RimM [Candidatus Eisenbacteria bacterium]|uniref:Ribosome maturation factor RimM n=1 Tax=Eiseniibacteriota bacterium TaxID=2212470 RepID=A0A937XDR7_UNCEI|nr:16S rRNA processing protein RimM [Candidatus Eisenbacteria bacterium]